MTVPVRPTPPPQATSTGRPARSSACSARTHRLSPVARQQEVGPLHPRVPPGQRAVVPSAEPRGSEVEPAAWRRPVRQRVAQIPAADPGSVGEFDRTGQGRDGHGPFSARAEHVRRSTSPPRASGRSGDGARGGRRPRPGPGDGARAAVGARVEASCGSGGAHGIGS